MLRARLSDHAVKFTRNIFVPGIQVYNFDNSVCLHIYGYLYRLSKKMREGNVFSRVCPSVFSQGGGGSGVTITYDALDFTVQLTSYWNAVLYFASALNFFREKDYLTFTVFGRVIP